MDYYFTFMNFFVGLGLGVIFFGGLFLTVHNLRDFPNPGVVMLTSFMLRTAIVLAGFYSVSITGKIGILPALAGFGVSMVFIKIFTSLPGWILASGQKAGKKIVPGNENTDENKSMSKKLN
jgi:F1F0 ATPase subunit 2